MSICSISPRLTPAVRLHYINSSALCCKDPASLCYRNTWMGHTPRAGQGFQDYHFYPQLRYNQGHLASPEDLPCCTPGGPLDLVRQIHWETAHSRTRWQYLHVIPNGITCLSVSKLKDLQNWRHGCVTHLEVPVALVPQPLFDQGFPSHPSNQVLLQKCALVWRIPAIKLYQYPVKALPFTPSTPWRPGCPGWPGFPLVPIIPGRPLGPWGPVRPGGPGDPGWLWHLVQPLCWLPSNNEGSSTRTMTIKEDFRLVLEAHNLLYICIRWYSLRRISLQICRMWLSDTSPAWNKECCAFSRNSHSCVTIKSPR